jgi:hypothetical protein
MEPDPPPLELELAPLELGLALFGGRTGSVWLFPLNLELSLLKLELTPLEVRTGPLSNLN